MEHLDFEFSSAKKRSSVAGKYVLVGVVGSGNLEVLMEKKDLNGKCLFSVDTAANGFGKIWSAVLQDFVERSSASDLLVSINDYAAAPSVVSLRLDQALEALEEK